MTDHANDPSIREKNSVQTGSPNKRSLSYVLRSGLAGGLAGCTAKTVVAPLERIKILFQTSNPYFTKYVTLRFGLVAAMKDITQSQGLRGLFKGHSATLLRIFPYAAINYLAYEQYRAAIIPSKDKETSLRRLASGSMAGVTSTSLTYPLELVRVRLAYETKKSSRSSYLDICRQIYNEGTPNTNPPRDAVTQSALKTPTPSPWTGYQNFYRGFTPTLLGMLPYAGISFLAHDTIGDWFRSSLAPYTTLPVVDVQTRHEDHRPHVRLTAAAQLVSGALAGVLAQTVSYPLEVVRRRMQVGGVHRAALGIVETARAIYRDCGFRGLYVGLAIGYVKVVPMVATSFFVYERVKWYLGLYGNK